MAMHFPTGCAVLFKEATIKGLDSGFNAAPLCLSTSINPPNAMRELVVKNYNGFPIEFEMINGQLMANATAMCAIFGKRPAHWLDLEGTKRYIKALDARSGIPTPTNESVSGFPTPTSKSEFRTLVEVRNGGTNYGTWIHERLILKLAQWLNVDFEIQCDEWVAELLRTGQVELMPAQPTVPAVQSQAELILMLAQQNVETERRMVALEEKVQEVVAKVTTTNVDYYTVAGYASLHRLRMTPDQANTYGRQAAALSRAHGYAVTKVHDSRYGHVNNYHQDILAQVMRVQRQLAA
ncbi:KilA-N domain-containing protein [Hymenobacter metallilatus]|nr:KilA-N domain-containing protein [Hymenobacter metallilatus]